MSYCRRGDDSDVYVIRSVYGPWVCYCEPGFNSETPGGMLQHLQGHIEMGDKVPKRALVRLRSDVETFTKGAGVDR